MRKGETEEGLNEREREKYGKKMSQTESEE